MTCITFNYDLYNIVCLSNLIYLALSFSNLCVLIFVVGSLWLTTSSKKECLFGRQSFFPVHICAMEI